MRTDPALERLLRSEEPSIRWKARVGVLGESSDSRRIQRLQAEIRRSPRVRALLTRRRILGRPGTSRALYYKWQGLHWALARLADIGYPAGDRELHPIRDRLLEYWLRADYYKEFRPSTKAAAYRGKGVPRMRGRYRRCASQQGNALHYLTKLGLDDGRCADLVERLLHWQWPDGGWNCDRDPAAAVSSFHETLLPMRGLAAYTQVHRAPDVARAARTAGEVFLRRGLYRRLSDGTVMRPEFVRLHYPSYWHYDVLAGLTGMAELGGIRDQRCGDALDLLERKRLRDGGWPAEAKFYKVRPNQFVDGGEFVDWGPAGSRRSNPWVTAEAMSVLRATGRLVL